MLVYYLSLALIFLYSSFYKIAKFYRSFYPWDHVAIHKQFFLDRQPWKADRYRLVPKP